MNRQNALRHLMFEHFSDRPSERYGKTKLMRAITAWNVALGLSDGDEKKVTRKLLDDVIIAVDSGENVIEAFGNPENEIFNRVHDKQREPADE